MTTRCAHLVKNNKKDYKSNFNWLQRSQFIWFKIKKGCIRFEFLPPAFLTNEWVICGTTGQNRKQNDGAARRLIFVDDIALTLMIQSQTRKHRERCRLIFRLTLLLITDDYKTTNKVMMIMTEVSNLPQTLRLSFELCCCFLKRL